MAADSRSSISQAETLERIGEFWDTHDFTDYDDPALPDVEMTISGVTEVKDYLDVSVVWEKSADPEYPYHAEIEGEQCLIRLNDFPDEHLYTLLADGVAVADFDDWPSNWVRPGG
jgi:hypothetical protein